MIHENTKQLRFENGLVTGIQLFIEEDSQSKYKVTELELIDETTAQGRTIAYCDSPSQLYLCYPYRRGYKNFENEIPVGKEVVIANGFNPNDYGYLAIKSENGDVVGGLGLPANHHVSFKIKWEEKQREEVGEDLLYRCLYAEARGESIQGQIHVLNVIQNRLNDYRWPNTIDAVISQPYQFSVAEKTIELPILRWLCNLALENKLIKMTEATHYHTLDSNPYWAKLLKYLVTVGDHKFYKE